MSWKCFRTLLLLLLISALLAVPAYAEGEAQEQSGPDRRGENAERDHDRHDRQHGNQRFPYFGFHCPIMCRMLPAF